MKHVAIFGLGVAGFLTVGLAPTAFAVDAETPAVEEPVVESTPLEEVDTVVEADPVVPFLDLLYAAPHEGLHLGDDTTIVIAQTLPATYSLVSYMSTGAKCIAPYDAPAATTTKTGTETDADHIARTIVASGTDTDDNGIDDHYEGTYDENGIAACKIKVTDEHGNMDWKYIYINVGLPKPAKTPTGNDFDTGATTTVVDPPASTQAPVQAAAAPAEVAGAAVSAEATLPRTGAGTWIAVILGAGLAALGASMVMITRRRRPATDHRHRFMIG